MYRDYTEATFDELKRQIKEINDSDFSIITDALGDLWYTFQSWIGVLKIDNYLDDVSSYHKKVLDQHNTSIADLDRIFNAVHTVDQNYSVKVGDINSTMDTYHRFLAQMTELINPTAFGFTASAVRAQMDAMSQEMTDAANKLDEVYDESLIMREKQIAKDAALGLIGDLLSVPAHIFGFTINVAKGNIAGAAADGWGLINDVFTTGEDLCALAEVGLGKVISGLNGGQKSYRLYAIGEADQMQARTGLSSELEAAGCPEWMVKGCEAIDLGAEVVGFVSTAKGFVGDAGEAAKVLGSGTLSNTTKWAYIKDLFFQDMGFSFMDYNNETIIGWAKNQKGFWKNAKTIYTWAKAFDEGTGLEEFIGGFDIPGIAEKTKSIVDDATDWVQPWLFNAA